MHPKTQIIKAVCESLLAGDIAAATTTAREGYPFVSPQSTGRHYTEAQCTAVFVRDGFIDRYSGAHLVFPGTLRLLSRLLPSQFPFHPNWKMSETHMAYWELFPTVDHVTPIARGGTDDDSNWVTTSMLRNSAKSNWTLEELGWHLVPPGDLKQWDGMLRWFVEFIKQDQSYLTDRYIKTWHRAAILTEQIEESMQAANISNVKIDEMKRTCGPQGS